MGIADETVTFLKKNWKPTKKQWLISLAALVTQLTLLFFIDLFLSDRVPYIWEWGSKFLTIPPLSFIIPPLVLLGAAYYAKGKGHELGFASAYALLFTPVTGLSMMLTADVLALFTVAAIYLFSAWGFSRMLITKKYQEYGIAAVVFAVSDLIGRWILHFYRSGTPIGELLELYSYVDYLQTITSSVALKILAQGMLLGIPTWILAKELLKNKKIDLWKSVVLVGSTMYGLLLLSYLTNYIGIIIGGGLTSGFLLFLELDTYSIELLFPFIGLALYSFLKKKSLSK
jgi:hypothetical protein